MATYGSTGLLELVAGHFKGLGAPGRLRLLLLLGDGERTVGELVERTGLPQASVSKHLQQLHALGFVSRRREGVHVHYALADAEVIALCELMCDASVVQ